VTVRSFYLPKDETGGKALLIEKPTVNITGRWELTAEGVPRFTVEFTQEETSLSGKMTTPFGVFDFTGGTVSGNEIFF
jgi:hypothetical protein